MNLPFKEIVKQQIGAAIDMLENAIVACPEKVWGDRPGHHEFWYLAYHTIFFLDYYMSESSDGFAPPAPFTLSELDPAGVLPDRVYTKDELLSYLKHDHQKCMERIESLTDQTAQQRCGFEKPDFTVAELMVYMMRHVQHHVAQLNLILRQKTDSAPPWVAQGKS